MCCPNGSICQVQGETTEVASCCGLHPCAKARGCSPRRSDEIPLLFCVFQQYCIFTATVEEQLSDKFLCQLQSVFRGLVFLHCAFISSHPDSFSVDTRPCRFGAWLKATHIQTDLHLLISVISRFVKASAFITVVAAIGRLGVGTVQNIVSIQLPSSIFAVSAHPHIHEVAGRIET